MRWIIINLLNGLIATLPHLLVAGLIYQCPERVLILYDFISGFCQQAELRYGVDLSCCHIYVPDIC